MSSDALARFRALVAATLRRRYCPPPWTMQDLEQQAHQRLLQKIGPDYLGRMEAGEIPLQEINRAIDGAVDEVRSTFNKRRQRGLPEVTYTDSLPDLRAPPEPVVLRLEIERVLARYHARDREIIEAKRAGYSLDEIAPRVGVSRSTVHRVVQNFQKELAHVLEMDVIKRCS